MKKDANGFSEMELNVWHAFGNDESEGEKAEAVILGIKPNQESKNKIIRYHHEH